MSISVALRATPRAEKAVALVPGLVVSVIVSVLAVAGGRLEEWTLGRAIIEPLVLAILIGMLARTVRGGRAREEAGVRFVAKDLLEIAVCLLGATMDVPRLFASGPTLAIGIAALVTTALVAGFAIGRLTGLSPKLATLVACGNAICGNSAIAAVAPVIDADREDVAASIALTAVLGVVVVLGLPLLARPLGFSNYQYGVLAGLTVYAVPQVLAAAFAVSPLSGQVATAVKLGRVLMLGPVVTFFALRNRDAQAEGGEATASPRAILRYVPWFVIGFVVLATLRSLHVVPDDAAAIVKSVAGWLTIAAMAALGLGVDVRSVRRVGARVTIAVGGSLAALLVLAIGLIRFGRI
ncbi:MAG TPA: putative sulfate exporter family transporter [Gemmatimonadaceae bacterium]|nr:putative sulfate exporter family transporter [Gemmatimonadaceae bacterium]